METVSFNVPSITCSVCSGKIREGLSNLKGVENVAMDLKSQTVKVDFNPDEINPQDIRKQVSKMGYEVIT